MPSWGYFIDMFLYYPKGQKLEALELNMPKSTSCLTTQLFFREGGRANTVGFSTLIKLFLILCGNPLDIRYLCSPFKTSHVWHHPPSCPPMVTCYPLSSMEKTEFSGSTKHGGGDAYHGPTDLKDQVDIRPRWGFTDSTNTSNPMGMGWKFWKIRSGLYNCKIWKDPENIERAQEVRLIFFHAFLCVCVGNTTLKWQCTLILAARHTRRRWDRSKNLKFWLTKPPQKKTHRISVGSGKIYKSNMSILDQKNFGSQELNFWPLRGPNPKEC